VRGKVTCRLALALSALLASTLLLTCGCGSKALQYAREARSSYISARAVLVGLKEFPSRMEELLKEGDQAALSEEAEALVEEARRLASAAASAFGTVEEKCGPLAAEGQGDLASYGEKMSELVDLNLKVINAYGELVNYCETALQGLPFTGNPEELASLLEGMDGAARKIRELSDQVAAQEEEAESMYRRAVE